MLLSVQTAAEQPARQQPSMRSSRTRVALAAGLVAMGVEMGVGLRILIAICCRMDWIACSSSATKNQKRTKFAQSNAANIFPSSISISPSPSNPSTPSTASRLVEL